MRQLYAAAITWGLFPSLESMTLKNRPTIFELDQDFHEVYHWY